MRIITCYQRVFLSVMVLTMMVIISGCASEASAPPTTQDIPTVSSTTNIVVKTGQATVDGKQEAILTDINGKTLYYFTPDVLHKVACATGCTDTWFPLLFKGIGAVNADGKLSGELTTDKDDNGNQVVYNGHYLYTYSGDSAPGDTYGQAIGKKWYVATPHLG